MTHNVKSELRRSMDAIHFSGDDKERMVVLLMSAEAPRQRRSGKKLLLLARRCSPAGREALRRSTTRPSRSRSRQRKAACP